MMKIFWMLTLIFFFGTACANHAEPMDQDTLVIGVESFPDQLDPRLATDALSQKLNQLIYAGLMRINQNLDVEPDLAESIQFLDNQTLSVQLKPKLRFHDGTALTASDVLATYTSIQDPKLASPQRSAFMKITELAIINDHQLIFKLAEPYSPILTTLTMGIIPARIVQGKFDPIGAGPFRFGEVKNREKISLLRNETYHAEPPKLRKLVFRTIFEDTLRTLELMKGRLDLVQNAIPQVLLPAIEQEVLAGKLKSITDSGVNFNYVGLNLRDPKLKDARVREAMSLAIDREKLIRYKMKNLATVATGLLSPKHWAQQAQLKPPRYDPMRAKQLLDEAGFADPDGAGPQPRFTLVYKTSSKRDRVELALLIAQYLREVGIEVEVKSFEWGTFFRDIRTGNFQIYTSQWVGVTEPDIFYYAFHSSQTPPQGANRGFYLNQKLDQLAERGQQVFAKDERKKIYDEVQKIIAQDFVYLPLWHENNWAVMQAGVKGFSLWPNASFSSLIKVTKED